MLDQWRSAYEQLYDISMKQFAWLKDQLPQDPADWEQMSLWAQQRVELRASIEVMQKQLIEDLGEEQVKDIFESNLASTLSTARVATFEASRKIELAMITAGTDLHNAQNHRKLTNAYSGLDYDHNESLFFDEKK